jgi:hypothetical protein
MEQALKEKLLREARLHNACAEGIEKIRNLPDIERAIMYYVQIIDWSLERNYPSLTFLRENFDKEELASFGIFIDKHFHGELLNDLQAYVFHNCTGHINVALNTEKAIIPMLYFANGCNMKIGCEEEYFKPIRVPIYIFGDNSISAISDENIEFTRYESELV